MHGSNNGNGGKLKIKLCTACSFTFWQGKPNEFLCVASTIGIRIFCVHSWENVKYTVRRIFRIFCHFCSRLIFCTNTPIVHILIGWLERSTYTYAHHWMALQLCTNGLIKACVRRAEKVNMCALELVYIGIYIVNSLAKFQKTFLLP